jgi:hypothetical protein
VAGVQEGINSQIGDCLEFQAKFGLDSVVNRM